MVSIFNAIRQNNIDVLKHLIALTTGETIIATPSCITKEDSQWIQQHWKQGSKQFDLNKRSTKGRTPLHCAATWNRVQIAQLLIECPQVGINIKDNENGWTALHRALYNGNIEIAKMLLDREDIDVTIKDNEGYTAFEIYNSSINDAFPKPKQITNSNNKSFSGGTDVYTWGSNTNYVLGHPDSEGRTRPERVNMQLDSQRTSLIMMRPDYVIESVTMSKYHTAILTSETVNNLLMCGFGRGGRLGISKEIETQLTPVPVKWPERIVSIALGRDHSIAVTESGNVLSFGSNEFGQLGYDLESRSKDEHPMQLVPRKIQAQNLKKQSILGVAASRIHSVVYTSTDIFTFGLNQGQLGYHQPDSEQCQFIPRKVTISSELIQVVVNDNATAILNKSHEVILLHNFNQQKIIFPMNRFPSNIQVHTPAANYIVKLIGSGTDYLGAISNTGDVFVWTCKAPRISSSSINEQRQKSKYSSNLVSAPKRIWTLRKAHLAASDASLGQYGELIVCTVSGHVFIGQPSREKAIGYKFSQVPFLQRCIQVCANPSGAFAALRSEYTMDLPDIPPSTIIEDIMASLPYKSIQDTLKGNIISLKSEMEQEITKQKEAIIKNHDNEEYLESRLNNVEKTFDKRLNDIVESAWHDVQVESTKDQALDIIFRVHSRDIYCHSAMIRCRSPSFFKQLIHMEDYHNGKFKFKVRKHLNSRILVQIDHCELASLLLLMDYLYTDNFEHPMKAYFEIPPLSLTSINDQQKVKKALVKLVMIQKDLVGLADFFQLPHLANSARASFHNAPVPTLKNDFKYLLEHEKGVDITLNTKSDDAQNGNLKCHEFIMRQRSTFFKNLLLPESVWMEERRSRQEEKEEESKMAILKLDMISSEAMQVILNHIYLDQVTIFDDISKENEETMLRFLLDVLSESDALLIYRLKAITGKYLIKFIKLRTACMILSYAYFHIADELKSACMKFITANLPIYLNSSMLNDLPISLFRELECFIKSTQSIPSIQPCHDTFTEIEDDEFSTSLYALSKNDSYVSPYIEILITLYPEKLSLEDVVVDLKPRGSKKTAAIDTKKKKAVDNTQSITIPTEKSSPPLPIATNPAGWMTDSLESVSVPSLREILDAEPAPSALNAAKNTKHTAVKKKSQKERRKIQQQDFAATTQSDSTQKSVWGKVEPVKPVLISEASASSVAKVLDSDKKGKKIYISEKEILDKQDLRKPDLGRQEDVFDPMHCFGSTFKLTSICRPNSKKLSTKTNKEQSSFETIQKQQEIEDKWLKGNRPKKNILRIQKEEQAVKDLVQHYIQTLEVMTGEWIDVHRVEVLL